MKSPVSLPLLSHFRGRQSYTSCVASSDEGPEIPTDCSSIQVWGIPIFIDLYIGRIINCFLWLSSVLSCIKEISTKYIIINIFSPTFTDMHAWEDTRMTFQNLFKVFLFSHRRLLYNVFKFCTLNIRYKDMRTKSGKSVWYDCNILYTLFELFIRMYSVFLYHYIIYSVFFIPYSGFFLLRNTIFSSFYKKPVLTSWKNGCQKLIAKVWNIHDY